ncbi:MAG: carboxypeptidase-like regulatory domain-containing protein [Acidimicrobiales bacterium]
MGLRRRLAAGAVGGRSVRRRLAAAAVTALVAIALPSCSAVHGLDFPAPPPTSGAGVTQPTFPGNLASAAEGGVAGVTTTTAPPIGPGAATLNGTVFAPSGPVAGATVRADRLVGDASASTETTTAADGSWAITGILGGRYRVRAWLAPNLAATTPLIFFLGASDTHTMNIELTSFTGTDVASAVAPSPPTQGEPANLVVQVTNPTVGSDGVVRDTPVVGAGVTLDAGAGWAVSSANPAPTDVAGRVLFQVSCLQDGDDPLSVSVGAGVPVALQVPPCGAPPPPATSSPCPPPTGSTSSGPAPTTSTLLPGSC